jgi:hypothetical protein
MHLGVFYLTQGNPLIVQQFKCRPLDSPTPLKTIVVNSFYMITDITSSTLANVNYKAALKNQVEIL